MKKEYYLTEFKSTFLPFGIFERNSLTISLGLFAIFPTVVFIQNNVLGLSQSQWWGVYFFLYIPLLQLVDSTRETNAIYRIYRKEKWKKWKLRTFKKDLSPLDIPNFIEFEIGDTIEVGIGLFSFNDVLNKIIRSDKDSFKHDMEQYWSLSFTYKGVDNNGNIVLCYRDIFYSLTVKEYFTLETLNISVEHRKKKISLERLKNKSDEISKNLKNSYVQQHIDDLKKTLKELEE